jgi:UDP-glucuronate 4-epimerase
MQLMDFTHTIEDTIGKKAILEMYPIQQGDVSHTFADTTTLEGNFGYCPKVMLKDGIEKFIECVKCLNCDL